MTVWTPGHGPKPLGSATTLTKAERTWIERRATEETGRTAPSLSGRQRRACQRIADQAVRIGDALHNASVTHPPPSYGEIGRRGPGPSDPSLALITATHDAIDRAVWRWAHMLDDCLLCDQDGHNDREDTLAGLLDDDWTEIVDHLVGLSTTSPFALRSAISRAVLAYHGAADRLDDWWRQLHADGAEPDVLENLTGRTERLAGRLAGLAGQLAQWIPGPQVRTCKETDCGAAMEVRPGGQRGDGATCGRCRQRKYEQKNRPA